MSDVLYRVRTVYETDTSKGLAGVAGMSSALSGLGGILGAVKSGLGTLFNAGMIAGAAGVAAGIAAVTYGVTSLNGRLEETTVGIAGMVRAAQVTNESGGIATWSESMAFAEQAMAQIRVDAAALPGEADDFVEVFRAGIAPALEAGMRAVDVAQFTNRFAAVGISFHVDAPQVGRDLNLMLQGRAGAHVNMWNRLKSTIGKTAAEFNALTAAQRQALIDRALLRYQDMIDAYSNTWSAISSTTVSYGKDLLRVMSAPVFEVAKKELRSINDWWARNQRYVNEVANGIGHRLVNSYKVAQRSARELYDTMNAFSAGPMGQRIMGFGSSVMRGVQALGQRAVGFARDNPASIAMGGAAAYGAARGVPGLGILAGGLISFAGHTDAVNQTLGNLSQIGVGASGALSGMWAMLSGVDNALGNILAGALPPLSAGLLNMTDGVLYVFRNFGPAFGELLTSMGPILAIFGGIVGGLGQIVGTTLQGAMILASDAVTEFARATRGAIADIGGWLREHGITRASVDRAGTWVGNNLNAPVTGAIGALYTGLNQSIDFYARGLANSAVSAATNGDMRDYFGRPQGNTFMELYTRYRDQYRLNNGLMQFGQNNAVPWRPPGSDQTPAHEPTIAERLAALQTTMRESMDRLRQGMPTTQAGALGGRDQRHAQTPGRPVVNVHIHQTISTIEDPDRLLVLTRRAVIQGIHGGIESPSARVTR